MAVITSRDGKSGRGWSWTYVLLYIHVWTLLDLPFMRYLTFLHFLWSTQSLTPLSISSEVLLEEDTGQNNLITYI